MAHHEFLPLCDVLFNIISLASYFCDVVFDVVMAYALFERGRHIWFAVSLTFVSTSLILSQVISLNWYLRTCETKRFIKENSKNEAELNGNEEVLANRHHVVRWLVVFVHFIQCGIVWRYFKLFIPVDLRYVKHEVRDLCMLRLFHAFCEAAPMLLIQLYLLWQETSPRELSDLNIVSTVLSLFSVCWALASFSKNVRLQNVHRLVLTWLGVISQFLWRLGTVASRVTVLTVYATLYGYWVFLVIGLHWISMFLWLISPKNVFHGEHMSRQRKAAFSALIAIVYIFSYINLQEVNPRQKMITFYVVMFLENSLLVIAWLVGVWDEAPWYRDTVPFFVLVSFATGMAFMMLYYRYFHVRRYRLSNQVQGHQNVSSPFSYLIMSGGTDSLTRFKATRMRYRLSNQVQGHQNVSSPFSCLFMSGGTDSLTRFKATRTRYRLSNQVQGHQNVSSPFSCLFMSGGTDSLTRFKATRTLRYETGGRRSNNNCDSTQRLSNTEGDVCKEDRSSLCNKTQGSQQNGKTVSNGYQQYSNGYLPYNHGGIPGVFNCRFNNPAVSAAATKRKKKKPTSFVPPPIVTMPSVGLPAQQKDCEFTEGPLSNGSSAAMLVEQPSVAGGSSDNEASSVGSRVNIQQKLQEKKQKQLAELRVIEEEIKQGKIPRPGGSGAPSGVGEDFGSLPRQPIPRAKRHSQGGWSPPSPPTSRALPPPYSYHLLPPPSSRAKHRANTPEILLAPHYLENNGLYYGWDHDRAPVYRLSDQEHIERDCSSEPASDTVDQTNAHPQGLVMYKSYRIPSDMDSQISLPRSYTLPRQFKYHRRPKSRKAIRSEHFVASTNSSDGDVDSGDETPHHNQPRVARLRPYRGYVRRDLHETKL
uniref:XK-related protein n=1 Tax=Timema monikensis TaxID=170555 RepID=A0A7R9HTW9_9NEOP|nr:unnamed protein product [Timema monikensis]